MCFVCNVLTPEKPRLSKQIHTHMPHLRSRILCGALIAQPEGLPMGSECCLSSVILSPTLCIKQLEVPVYTLNTLSWFDVFSVYFREGAIWTH